MIDKIVYYNDLGYDKRSFSFLTNNCSLIVGRNNDN